MGKFGAINMKRFCLLLAVLYGCQSAPPEAKRTDPKAVPAPKKTVTKTVVDTLTIELQSGPTDMPTEKGRYSLLRWQTLCRVFRFLGWRLSKCRTITETLPEQRWGQWVDALQSAIDRVKKPLESGIDAKHS